MTDQLPQGTPLSELPRFWQSEIKSLRRECAKTRIQLREARAQVAALQSR